MRLCMQEVSKCVCMCVSVCVCDTINSQGVDHLVSAVNGVHIVQGRIEEYRVEVGDCFHRA